VIGQVASQTLENMTAIARRRMESAAAVGMDKDEIGADGDRHASLSIIPTRMLHAVHAAAPATRALARGGAAEQRSDRGDGGSRRRPSVVEDFGSRC
jgi:hypothetical protein